MRALSKLDPRCPQCGVAKLPTGWPRCTRCDKLTKRATRKTEPKGVYIAVLKTLYADPAFIIKVGQSGQLRSKAGRLASDARNKHGIVTDWAEVVRYVPIDDYHERRTLEDQMLRAMRYDVYDETDEYFWPGAYDAFVAMLGPEAVPFERRTTKARVKQFLDGLDLAA